MNNSKNEKLSVAKMSDMHMHTLKIEKSKLDLIIGHNGSKIAKYEKTFHVFIKVDKTNPPSMKVFGNKAANVNRAVRELLQVIGHMETINIDEDKLGIVIGRKGCNMKQLENKWQVSIQIIRLPIPSVQVFGNPTDISNAIKEIQMILKFQEIIEIKGGLPTGSFVAYKANDIRKLEKRFHVRIDVLLLPSPMIRIYMGQVDNVQGAAKEVRKLWEMHMQEQNHFEEANK